MSDALEANADLLPLSKPNWMTLSNSPMHWNTSSTTNRTRESNEQSVVEGVQCTKHLSKGDEFAAGWWLRHPL
jgi:hypothetical protein